MVTLILKFSNGGLKIKQDYKKLKDKVNIGKGVAIDFINYTMDKTTLSLSFRNSAQSRTASAEHPPFLKKKLAECSGVEFSILYEPLCIFIHRKFFLKSIFIHFHLFSSS